MFVSLSIRARLFVSYSVLLLLLLSVAAVSLQRLDTLTATTHTLVDYHGKRVFLTQIVNQHAQAAANRLLTLLQTPERDKRVPLYTAMDAEIAAVDATLSELTMMSISPDAKAALDRVIACREKYGERFQSSVEMLELRGPLAARIHFENETQDSLEKLLIETLALSRLQQQAMQQELGELEQAAASARQLLAYIALAVLTLGILLTLLISRSIVRPIREAVTVAEAIATGDYQRHVPPGKNDEIGALLKSLAVMRDSISSREEKISRLAYVDTLTGLHNRTYFFEQFATIPPQSTGAIVVLNIDRFAPINSALGHDVGDRLLREISLRLQAATDQTHLLARVWGDEFAFLLEGASFLEAEAFIQRMLDTLHKPMDIDGQRLDVDGTFGIALYPRDGSAALTLLRRADAAMQVAKRRHEKFACCEGLDDGPTHEQLSLIGEMRQALAKSEFTVHYQPKLNLAQNQITAAEALIRWQHPTKGMVPPFRFIPFAEQTGFITEITPWVIREVIAHAAAWRADGLSIVASINLSTYDLLSRDLVLAVQQTLAEHDLPADQICLEITESALMDEPELALKHLNELSAHGLKLSIDDYGSGQASLGYVKTLPVNELKIDRVFVTNIDTEPKNAAIVRSTILLCSELGLSVVAEGAETEAELAWLRKAGCDMIQGYGIAKPMPLPAFLEWVRNFNQANTPPSA